MFPNGDFEVVIFPNLLAHSVGIVVGRKTDGRVIVLRPELGYGAIDAWPSSGLRVQDERGWIGVALSLARRVESPEWLANVAHHLLPPEDGVSVLRELGLAMQRLGAPPVPEKWRKVILGIADDIDLADKANPQGLLNGVADNVLLHPLVRLGVAGFRSVRPEFAATVLRALGMPNTPYIDTRFGDWCLRWGVVFDCIRHRLTDRDLEFLRLAYGELSSSDLSALLVMGDPLCSALLALRAEALRRENPDAQGYTDHSAPWDDVPHPGGGD